MRHIVALILCITSLYTNKLLAQTASFNAPDTVCRGQNITITNTSTGQTTNDWNFCKQQLIQGVTGVNLGAIANMPYRPQCIQIFKEGANWIGFLGNDGSELIRRLNFGSSLLNTPTITSLPSFNQLQIPRVIRFIKEGNDWYAIVISGYDGNASNYQGCAVLFFGTSLNNTPTLYKDLGNLSGLITGDESMAGVSLEKSGNNVIAMISTFEGVANSGNIYRVNFGTTITNLNPTYTALGNFGVFTRLNTIKFIQLQNKWYGFAANDGYPNNPANDKLFRLDFGNSLLNSPTVTDLGNPNMQMNRIYDLLPYTDCESIKLLGANLANSQLISISFPAGLSTNTVSATSLGNVATLDQPAGFSQVLIENGQKYVFIVNSNSSTISRILVEPVCVPFGVSSSTLTNPPVFSTDLLGTMTVSLTINKNLANEASTCQEIVVVDTIKKPDARINTITCSTDSIRLTIANIDSTATYSWIGPNGFTSTRPNVSIKFNGNNTQNGNYIVTTTGRCGIKKDTIILNASCLTVTASFTAPDTVCRGQNITISNTSTGQSTNQWNFCKNNLTHLITGTNIGTPVGMPSRPHRMDIVNENGTWIGILGNDAFSHTPLVRLNFGNSLLNSPVITNLPSFTFLDHSPVDLQLYKENNEWYCFTRVSYDNSGGMDIHAAIIKFGSSLLNVPTLFRDFGNLNGVNGVYGAIDVAKDNNNLVEFITVDNIGLIRLDFTNSISNTPIVTNMGTLGGTLATRISDIKLVNKNGQWYGFVTDYSNSRLLRINFGNSLINNSPTVQNLGNPSGIMNGPVELTPQFDCDKFQLINANINGNNLTRISFPNGVVDNNPTAVSLGNIGNLNYPSGASKVLTENGIKYLYLSNGNTNSLTRIEMSICNNAGVPSSNSLNPPVFNFDSIGVYNITLILDEGLPTETQICKSIVVIDSLKKPDARINTITCSTDSIRLTIANIDPNATYSWTGSNGFTSTRPNVSIKFTGSNQAGQYIVTSTGRCGSKKDTVSFIAPTPFVVNLGRDTSICQGNSVTLNATTSGTTVTYLWSTGAVTPSISVNQTGTYFVKVTSDGCSASDTIKITILTPPTAFSIGKDTTYCGSFSRVLSTGNATTVWSTGVTASQITVTQEGTYTATITNSCGSKKDTIVISQNNIPLVNLGRDTSICQGNSVTLNATTSGTTVTYLWSTGAATPIISVNQTGTYFVKVTADGCSASDTIKVTILTPPTAFSIGNDTTYCGSFTRVLSTGNGNTVWSTGVTSSQITVTQAGTYIATVTNSCGSKKDTIVIQQNNIPLVNLGRDTSICQGSSIALNATTSGTTVTYLWSTGAATPTISVNQTGTYFVKVTADGCSASDTIKATILTPPTAFSIGNDTTYCGSFTRVLSTGNGNTVWSTGVTSSQITVIQAGTYIATITNSCGSETDTIEIQENVVPTVYINKDTVICDGNIIELSAVTDAQKYVWNTGDTTKNINISQHGIYWVEVSNNNCVATDTAFIDECEGDLWVPNAFTPNNDKTNDVFQVFGKRLIEYHLIVFNRWGEKLFESYDINNSWDGTQKGELVQVDAYAWVIFYKINLDGRVQDKMKKGTVSVLR
jgi:gliding motility-associated-like protein